MSRFHHSHIDALAAQLIEIANSIPSFGEGRESRLRMIRDRFDKALIFSFPLADWEKMPRAEARR